MSKTYLEYRDEKSSKFWEITLEGDSHTVRYGRIGTDGQSKTKTFDSADEAKKSAEKLIASKVKKGYAEAKSDDEGGADTDTIREAFMLVWVQDDPVEERVARLRELLDGGLDPNVTGDKVDEDSEPKTPLHFAVAPDRRYYSASADETLDATLELPIIETLLEYGADPNIETHYEQPMHSAIEWNDDDPEVAAQAAKVIRLLHEHGEPLEDVKPADLSCADPVMMKAFIDLGYDIEAADDDGNTALMAAISSERERLVELLLEHGAKTDVMNAKGQTPLAMAKKMREYNAEQKARKSKIIELLEAGDAPAKMKIEASLDLLPCDMDALRDAADELGMLDELSYLLDQEFGTYQELAAEAHDAIGDGDPPRSAGLAASCAKALGKPTTRRFDGDQSFRKAFFHHGDVEIDGSLYTSDTFLVTGDVRVKTMITDCGPDSFIVIGGDVHAGGVWTDGEVHITGDLHAEQFVYGYYNDNVLSAKAIHAPLLIADDHTFWADEFEVERMYQYDEYDSADPVFHEFLIDECFDDDELSQAKLSEVVKGGGSIFQ